ncbi:STAS domain-containing protein [Actinacidiphila sp. bgisy167]|uniref:STAS domain-containing protein n=1 Tax=Actinacidiphila sp. bgisy167 TaxID=3413797 RepID=UPI003D73375E
MSPYLRTRTIDGCVVVELSGEIDIVAAVEITPLLDALTRAPGPDLVVDLDPVDFIDCSGLAVLCRIRSRVHACGGLVQFVCSRPPALRVLRAAGLMNALRPVPSVDEALARFGRP